MILHCTYPNDTLFSVGLNYVRYSLVNIIAPVGEVPLAVHCTLCVERNSGFIFRYIWVNGIPLYAKSDGLCLPSTGRGLIDVGVNVGGATCMR